MRAGSRGPVRAGSVPTPGPAWEAPRDPRTTWSGATAVRPSEGVAEDGANPEHHRRVQRGRGPEHSEDMALAGVRLVPSET
jgi:hypothetical protein